MLQININSNIDDYKESVFAGLDAKQTLWAIAGFIAMIASIVIMTMLLNVPIIISVYIAMPIAIPFILTGFSIKDGMSFWQRMKQKKMMRMMPVLSYVSTENREFYMNQAEKRISVIQNEENGQEEFQQIVKQTKLILGCFGILFFLIIIAIIVFFSLKG